MPLLNIDFNLEYRLEGTTASKLFFYSQTLFARRFRYQACSFGQLQGATEPAMIVLETGKGNTSPLTIPDPKKHLCNKAKAALAKRSGPIWPLERASTRFTSLAHWLAKLMWNLFELVTGNSVLSFGALSDEATILDTKLCQVAVVLKRYTTQRSFTAGQARSRNSTDHLWPVIIRESVFFLFDFCLKPSQNDMRPQGIKTGWHVRSCTPLPTIAPGNPPLGPPRDPCIWTRHPVEIRDCRSLGRSGDKQPFGQDTLP